jgi:hypothetical protein
VVNQYKEQIMTLKQLYQNAKVTLLANGGYDTKNKEIFGRKAVSFLRRACKLAGVQPDKKYPYHNKGGPAVLGEVYCNITLPDNSSHLEFIFGENLFGSVALYRTNTGKFWNQFGRNIWLQKETTEEDIAQIIRNFLTGKMNNQPMETGVVL